MEENRILIVDDERNVRGLLRKILEEKGYNVAAVATGEEALEEIKKGDFKLITVDIKLPGISGIEFIKRVRTQGLDTPILIISALTNAVPIVEAIKSGANDYLSKPFPSQDLVRKVRELVAIDQITFEKLERRIEEKLSEGKYAVAEKMARQLFALRPSADAHYVYANVLQKLGNHKLALRHLRAALSLDPNHKKASEEIQKYEKEHKEKN
ncbi:MAG TPA: response regulator [Kosmotoga arenicorallina]|uniref:Response regulator n=1 Tax=Kosmotoga arenicorallina TaxID=688066 RepID=A0A7C5DXU8_9BACT|nr:response regulator [Kosmotoga arenicorallina]